jgi:hypothetical protein
VIRWVIFAGAGALIGASSFAFLLRADVPLGPIYVAGGCVAAGVEVWMARRMWVSPRLTRGRLAARATLVGVLVSAWHCSCSVFSSKPVLLPERSLNELGSSVNRRASNVD